MSKKAVGFSTDPDDATSGGLFGPGRAKFIKARYGLHKYKDKSGTVVNKAVALIIQLSRSGEKAVQAWTVGNGFGFSEDGLGLVPKDGQTGLSDSSNLYHLVKSLKDQGAPKDVYSQLGNDCSVLDGIVVELALKPLPKINDGKKGRDPDKPRTVLVVDDVIEASWVKGSKKKKSEDEEDEEDADADNDSDSDDDEEEEKPKKKKKPAADDDDEGDGADDEDLDEQAGEALIEALTDGPIKLSKIEDAVLAGIPKNKNKKAIAKRAADKKFLAKETGWSWDGKVVDLDK